MGVDKNTTLSVFLWGTFATEIPKKDIEQVSKTNGRKDPSTFFTHTCNVCGIYVRWKQVGNLKAHCNPKKCTRHKKAYAKANEYFNHMKNGDVTVRAFNE